MADMGRTFNQQTQNLIRAAQKGDESATERLFEVYSERILRIVRLRMGSGLRSSIESVDVVQDALVLAFRDLDSFSYTNEGDFLRWLSRIAENRIRDHLRKIHADKRDIRKEIPLNNMSATQDTLVRSNGPVDTTTPSLIMSKREDLNKLEKAMDTLRPEHKEIITMIKIEGLSYKEAGEKLGKSADAVRMLLSRAMVALSQNFEETE